jgi:hypothetical protein
MRVLPEYRGILYPKEITIFHGNGQAGGGEKHYLFKEK